MTNQKDLILKLNEDCMDHIFKMLPIGDRINLILSYQMFCHIFTLRLKIEYKSNLNTRFFNSLKTFQLKVLLFIIGAHIKNLIVEFPFEEKSYLKKQLYFKFLFKFCLNAENLSYNGWGVSDESIKSLRLLRNLKSLTIINNLDVTGKYIHNLYGLEKLTLNNCTRIDSQYFGKIFKNLKNLLFLDIRNCKQLSTQNFQQILENLLQLNTLKLSTTHENFNCLTQLAKLKHLEICRNNILSAPISQDFLDNLQTYQAQQLEELKLIDYDSFDSEKAALVAKLKKLKVLHCICNPCDDEILNELSHLSELEELDINNSYFITNQSVLQLLTQCQKLRRLYLRSCGILTSDLIQNILMLLHHQRQLQIERVHIQAYNTLPFKISEMELEDSSDVLKLSYKYTNPDYEHITEIIEIIK
ncbi:F-box and leucine-rich repeat protein 13-like [Calliphora vicina]|uniref:F-box and leucine-rich repeat protein 13-like n=1 Tax=Calliphora vicina TaxID=7373 RepID=UPI00325ADBB5